MVLTVAMTSVMAGGKSDTAAPQAEKSVTLVYVEVNPLDSIVGLV